MQPLAERLRPKTLDEYIGQKHLVGPGAILRKMIDAGRISSFILWGPPGVGKTTLAQIIANKLETPFYTLSAVTSGVKDVREVIDRAKSNRFFSQSSPILFIDEIHRFSKSQQDSLLGAVENGTVTLIGATTENPSFEVIRPLLSRCQLYVLKSLEKEDLLELLERAISTDTVLKERKIELKEEYNHIKVVVPGKTLNEVSKILTGGIEDNVHIFFTGRHIVFEFDDTIVVSRLIEGEYFRIEQMLSSDYETKISINKKELQSCIERASLLVKEGDKKPIIMNILDDSMELKINSFIGSMNEDIDIMKTGKDLMIGFNPKFILDALRVIDDENIDIYMINPKAPCFIRDEEQKYIYLILPVNFNPGV